jgi:lipoyl(octanoyl) transferase
LHSEILLRRLGARDYTETWRAMQDFTARRTAATPDEFWLVEHPPVFTMGLKGRAGDCTQIAGIPVVYTDRGGDITYHGPGQPIVYVLLDLARAHLGVKSLVERLEQGVIDLLAAHTIAAERRAGAPGVYVAGRKIASLGLRVRRGATYHGLAFNHDMDLAPFAAIDPCGYKGLPVTQFVDEIPGNATKPDRIQIEGELVANLARSLGYNSLKEA